MKTPPRSRIPRSLLSLLLCLCLPGLTQAGTGPDVRLYLIAKGQFFKQVGSGLPTLLPAADEPFAAFAQVEARDSDSVKSATVRSPLGEEGTLERQGSSWSFESYYGSKGALDSAAPAGNYTFTLDTVTQGLFSLNRPLGADAYPSSAPRIVNYTNLQGADPTLPLTIQWQAFPGGTENDHIRLFVEDANGDVFATGEPGAFGSLDGTDTSVTVPPGILSANTGYEVYLLFAKLTSIDATNNPGTTGLSAFFKETELYFTTGAPSTPPPAAGRFVFSSSVYEVPESAGGATITILRLGGAAAPASVTLTTSAGTASPGLDYLQSTNTYFFDFGVDALNVPVAILDDLVLDAGETVLLRLSDPAGGADIGSLSNAVLTIVDNEQSSRGVIQFNPSQLTVDESAGQALLTLTRTGGTQGEVSVKYETDDVTAEDPEDFADLEGTVVFPSGVTSRTLVIPIVSDARDEQDETFIVKLSDPTGGAALGTATVATVTIRDNDTSGLISLSAAAYTALESDAHVLITVRRTRGAAAGVSVEFATENLTAVSPGDYVGTNFTLVLASNEVARTLSIPIQPDSLPEGNESFRVTLRNPSPGAFLGPITNALVTLLDDEVTLQFAAVAATNTETSGQVVFAVERTGPVDVPASVRVSTLAGGTATPGLDFIATNVTVQFPTGSRKQTVALRLLNDQLVEGSETFPVALSNPSANALLGSRSQAVATIKDDDAGGKIQFALAALNAPEARTSTLLIVTRTMGLASNVTCRLATRALTATDGLDFVGTNTVLSWRANETRKLIPLPLLPDALVEGNEQFEVTLSDPAGGASLDARTNLTVTIKDDDKGGGIGFARSEVVVSENATNAVILINRTGGTAGGVTVRFLALEGTASSPADFAEQNVVVEFAPGQTSRSVLVPINNDTTPEGPETIQLILQDVTGGGVLSAGTNATLRILDDESSVAFSAATASGTEGSTVTLTVVRSGALNTSATVEFRTLDGTATAGADYRAASGTLSFSPGQASKTISLPLTADAVAEASETFSVELFNPQGGLQLKAPTTTTVTILNR